jgi:hypothetical protein
MHPLQSCHINTDIEFFRALKERHVSVKQPFLTSLVAANKCQHELRMYHRQLVDIQDTHNISPETRKQEYEYVTIPAEIRLPMNLNLLMHYIRYN